MDKTRRDKAVMKKKLFDDIPRLQSDRVILRRLVDADVPELEELVSSERVYRYLPTYLFEKQFSDMHVMIRRLYDTCFVAQESLILGVEPRGDGRICGLAEFYGLRDDMHKISVGYRLLERSWGQGIASEALRLMVDYLYAQTDIEIITASTMVENIASARVLEKNDFLRTARGVEEDWGYDSPTIADKWFC
jgi:ribosomal-protein-alanine N-acetyltransferase